MASSSSTTTTTSMRLLALVVVAALFHGTAAETHIVGDSTGWSIPGGDAQFYSKWASGKTFRVGDVLTFRFTTGQHDVAQVSKSEYDGCTANSPIGGVINTGPASITLNQTGAHHYICAFSGHCAAGQKLSINVVAGGSTAPSTSPSTTPSAPASGPAPPPTAGSSPGSPSAAPALMAGLGFTGVVAALFSALFL